MLYPEFIVKSSIYCQVQQGEDSQGGKIKRLYRAFRGSFIRADCRDRNVPFSLVVFLTELFGDRRQCLLGFFVQCWCETDLPSVGLNYFIFLPSCYLFLLLLLMSSFLALSPLTSLHFLILVTDWFTFQLPFFYNYSLAGGELL